MPRPGRPSQDARIVVKEGIVRPLLGLSLHKGATGCHQLVVRTNSPCEKGDKACFVRAPRDNCMPLPSPVLAAVHHARGL